MSVTAEILVKHLHSHPMDSAIRQLALRLVGALNDVVEIDERRLVNRGTHIKYWFRDYPTTEWNHCALMFKLGKSCLSIHPAAFQRLSELQAIGHRYEVPEDFWTDDDNPKDQFDWKITIRNHWLEEGGHECETRIVELVRELSRRYHRQITR